MNVSESSAVFTVLQWLGAADGPLDGHVVTHREAGEALASLAERAGKRLQLTVAPAPVVEAVERFGSVVTSARAVEAADGDSAMAEAMAALRWSLHDCKARG